jgi:microcystin-dependent protein
MATNPFLGQLSLVGFNFAPQGWALAAGQTLTLSQYTALFSLLGTTYGGNGTNNFMLPNLQAAVAVGNGQGTGLDLYPPGQTGGETTVTLQVAQTPPQGGDWQEGPRSIDAHR